MSLKTLFRRRKKRNEKRALATSLTTNASVDKKTRVFIENLLKIPEHKVKERTDYLRVGTDWVWASFRACNLTASFFLTADFEIRGANTQAKVENEELNRLMTQPNPHESWEELLYMWVFHIKLTGVAYWFKDQMDGRGRPLYIYPLLPQYMAPIPDEKEKIKGYSYRVNGREVIYDVDEIIEFKRPNPRKIYDGLGEIEPSSQLYDEYIARGALENKFLENGAMPSGVMTIEEMDDQDELDRIKEWWKAEYEGKRNAGKTAFLSGKWNFVKMGLTHAEMQSHEAEEWSVHQIFANHGVPLTVAGIEKAANRATAVQDEINFRKYEIAPLLDIFVGKLNTGGHGVPNALIKAFNENWKIVYLLSGLIDVQQIVAEYAPVVVLGGFTLNQLREKIGEPRDENNPFLDQYFVNNNRIPIEMAGMLPPGAIEEGAIDGVVAGPGVPADGDITALNGAQVTALTQVIQLVVTGVYERDLASAILEAAFPGIPPETLDRIITAAVNTPSIEPDDPRLQ